MCNNNQASSIERSLSSLINYKKKYYNLFRLNEKDKLINNKGIWGNYKFIKGIYFLLENKKFDL